MTRGKKNDTYILFRKDAYGKPVHVLGPFLQSEYQAAIAKYYDNIAPECLEETVFKKAYSEEYAYCFRRYWMDYVTGMLLGSGWVGNFRTDRSTQTIYTDWFKIMLLNGENRIIGLSFAVDTDPFYYPRLTVELTSYTQGILQVIMMPDHYIPLLGKPDQIYFGDRARHRAIAESALFGGTYVN